ncbi:MAG: hypothetical protein DRO11_05960 [Methanobacteriota archaeon]|nr:MAG: hypothetical protein DRO11_05960 [Euryarchaeota archaeon]
MVAPPFYYLMAVTLQGSSKPTLSRSSTQLQMYQNCVYKAFSWFLDLITGLVACAKDVTPKRGDNTTTTVGWERPVW